MIPSWLGKVFKALKPAPLSGVQLQREADIYQLYLCARYYYEAKHGAGLTADDISPDKAPQISKQKEFIQAVADEQVMLLLGSVSEQYAAHLNGATANEMGLPFTLQTAKSSMPNAGLGVFLKGHAVPGTVTCFYPGTVYSPWDLREMKNFPKIDRDNDYLIARHDAFVIDGKQPSLGVPPPTPSDGPAKEKKAGTGLDVFAPEATDARTQNEETWLQHPFALGHMINHPPPSNWPNVMPLTYDFASFIPEELRKYIPNKYYKKPNIFFNDDSVMRGLLMIATTHIQDEELFLNYRFNANQSLPDWYVPCDNDWDARRWG